MNRLIFTLAFAVAVLSLTTRAVHANDSTTGQATAPDKTQGRLLSFESDVRPILKAHCFYCHGEDGETEGGVDLRQVRLMLDSGAIDEESPEHSLLLEQIVSGEMPKEGKPLGDEEIRTIEKWIAAGFKTKRPEPNEVPDF